MTTDSQAIREASKMLCSVFLSGKKPSLFLCPAFDRRGISRETIQFFLDYRKELERKEETKFYYFNGSRLTVEN